MKIGLLASGGLGLILLKKISQEKNIEFVFTDSKSSEIINFCTRHQLPCFTGNPRIKPFFQFLEDKNSDIILSINYLFIAPKRLLEHPTKYSINFHGSLLPKYRGRTPHVWAIINNEKETGVTAHLMTEGCDEGAIVLQKTIAIEPFDTGATILKKYEVLYIEMVDEVINDIENNNLSVREQNTLNVTWFGKRTPEDGLIDWNWQKERIYNWVRAQANPYPGAFTFYNSQKVIIDSIAFSEYGFNSNEPNGNVHLINDFIYIKTPNGLVELVSYRIEKKIKFANETVFQNS